MTWRRWLLAGLVVVLVAVSSGSASEKEPGSPWTTNGFRGSGCSTFALPDLPSTYYGVDMVPTKRVPGTGRAKGWGKVSFGGSPFGVAVSSEGAYVYDVDLKIENMKPSHRGVFIAWATTSELDQVKRLGPLEKGDGDGEPFRLRGRVEWNKFLLVVTLEPPSGTEADARWRGPVVLRGMSRSGMMHTLAGHGPYESEPCGKYGFR